MFFVKYDILIIVIRSIYSLLIRKSNREIPKLITGKERSFMAIRKKQEPSEYQKALCKFHKKSNRHVVVFEADISEDEKRRIFSDADHLRQCGNELLGIMERNLEQLLRTKRYRALQKLYGKVSDPIHALEKKEVLSDEETQKLNHLKKERAEITNSMNQMRESYQVTWDFCRTKMMELKETYHLQSIFALSRAEDIWAAIETILYSSGRKLHFKKRGDLPEIRAKQSTRGLVIDSSQSGLIVKYGKVTIPCKYKAKDLWLWDEEKAILAYLAEPELQDAHAVDQMSKGIITDTYRPCFASLVCKKIRGRLRVYVHITVEGKAISKRRKDSTPRHYYGKGNIGCDIGTQTIAYTSNTEVGLENLAERGNSIQHVERQEALILRAMERSRRAMNPNHYNENGTVKKGHKQWNFSKRYQKLRQRHQKLCRIAAENRALAIREQVNHLRSLGDCFITEPPNAKKLQKRANPENPVDKNGRMKRKKRFGRSIKNRCPGYLQAKAKQLFESTGGMYVEVPILYRASQYDHTSDTYIPKKLSQRMYHLTDGTKVQRDWYSSYLLYCINKTYTQINKLKCRSNFATMYQKEKNMIEEIIRSGKKIMNSGIRTV